MDGVLYEFEYGREYRLYLSDSMFYFPTLIPSEKSCLPFVSKCEIGPSTLVLDSADIRFELTLHDSLLRLANKDYSLTFMRQKAPDTLVCNLSEIYYEIYFDGTYLVDSMTVNFQDNDLKCDGVRLDNYSYLSYFFWIANSVSGKDFNRVYGLNVADDYQIDVNFKSNDGTWYEIISYGKSFDQPYEILLLRDCILRVKWCLQ